MDTSEQIKISNRDLSELLRELLKKEGMIPNEVDPNRNYWFVRTQGGSYFDEFYFGRFVAIGWDDVPCLPESERTTQLIDQLKEKGYGVPTRVLNQVYRFCTALKCGDVVVIPSESSAAFAFGYIDSDDIYEVKPTLDDVESGKCVYTRRRKVRWITDVPRNRVDPKLFAFFRNQLALSQANEQAELIDRAISSFYIKNNVAHLTLSVEIEKSPRAEDIPTYMHGILARAYDLSARFGLVDEEDSDDALIISRINVQSEGIIELLGNPVFVFFVCVIVVALFGGNAKFNWTKDGASGDVGTNGLPCLIKTISEIMLDHKNDSYIGDKRMAKIQERLKIKDPREKE